MNSKEVLSVLEQRMDAMSREFQQAGLGTTVADAIMTLHSRVQRLELDKAELQLRVQKLEYGNSILIQRLLQAETNIAFMR